MNQGIDFQCAFCGETIEEKGYDPCVLEFSTHFDRRDRATESQTLWCHADCIRERVHQTVPLSVIDPEIYEP